MRIRMITVLQSLYQSHRTRLNGARRFVWATRPRENPCWSSKDFLFCYFPRRPFVLLTKNCSSMSLVHSIPLTGQTSTMACKDLLSLACGFAIRKRNILLKSYVDGGAPSGKRVRLRRRKWRWVRRGSGCRTRLISSGVNSGRAGGVRAGGSHTRGCPFHRVVCGDSLEILDIIPWPAPKVGVKRPAEASPHESHVSWIAVCSVFDRASLCADGCDERSDIY